MDEGWELRDDNEPPCVRDSVWEPVNAPRHHSRKPLRVIDHAVSLDSDKATVGETEDSEQHLGNADVSDNDSTDSFLSSEFGATDAPSRRREFIARSKATGRKFSRVAAAYVEGLEGRISVLEEELQKLQINIGTTGKENDNK